MSTQAYPGLLRHCEILCCLGLWTKGKLLRLTSEATGFKTQLLALLVVHSSYLFRHAYLCYG